MKAPENPEAFPATTAEELQKPFRQWAFCPGESSRLRLSSGGQIWVKVILLKNPMDRVLQFLVGRGRWGSLLQACVNIHRRLIMRNKCSWSESGLIGIRFPLLLVVLGLLVVSTRTRTLFAGVFSASGYVECQNLDQGGSVLGSARRDFKVLVADEKWRIETRNSTNTEEPVVLFSYDGNSLSRNSYYIESELAAMKEAYSGNRTLQPVSTNRNSGHLGWVENSLSVYSAKTPIFDRWLTLPVWLGFASSDFWSSVETNSFHDFTIGGDSPLMSGPPTVTSQIEEIRYPDYAILKQAQIFNLGYYTKQLPDGETVKVNYPSPFDRGFLRGMYRVESFDEIEGTNYPNTGVLELYGPNFNADSSSEVWCSLRARIHITQFTPDASSQAASANFSPSIDPGKLTSVTDTRTIERLGGNLSYYTRDRMLEPDSVASQDFIAKQQQRIAFAKKLRKDTRDRGRLIASILFAALILSPLVLIAYKRKFNRTQSTNR